MEIASREQREWLQAPRRIGAYKAHSFQLINKMMADNGDVVTRQVSRQLQRLKWKATFKVRQRRGVRCPYERSGA